MKPGNARTSGNDSSIGKETFRLTFNSLASDRASSPHGIAIDDRKLRFCAEKPRLLQRQSCSENRHLFIVSDFFGCALQSPKFDTPAGLRRSQAAETQKCPGGVNRGIEVAATGGIPTTAVAPPWRCPESGEALLI